jgi:hypothetical protein
MPYIPLNRIPVLYRLSCPFRQINARVRSDRDGQSYGRSAQGECCRFKSRSETCRVSGVGCDSSEGGIGGESGRSFARLLLERHRGNLHLRRRFNHPSVSLRHSLFGLQGNLRFSNRDPGPSIEVNLVGQPTVLENRSHATRRSAEAPPSVQVEGYAS